VTLRRGVSGLGKSCRVCRIRRPRGGGGRRTVPAAIGNRMEPTETQSPWTTLNWGENAVGMGGGGSKKKELCGPLDSETSRA